MTISKGVWTDQKSDRFVISYDHRLLSETIQDSLTGGSLGAASSLGVASNAAVLKCINVLADEIRQLRDTVEKLELAGVVRLSRDG